MTLLRLAHAQDVASTHSDALYIVIRSIFGTSKTTTTSGLNKRICVYVEVVKMCNENILTHTSADNILHYLNATSSSLPSSKMSIVVSVQ